MAKVTTDSDRMRSISLQVYAGQMTFWQFPSHESQLWDSWTQKSGFVFLQINYTGICMLCIGISVFNRSHYL